ncbi:MAG: gliding motility-associated C-terminal domain-containing protein [Spirochaetales bacterium]|nr:gliding motility-associated C-terminal domain-containing protein [Spirochaetales bacterium]
MRNRTILFIIIIFIIVQGLCYSGGHKEKPVITVMTESPQYLSPNNDGVQDTAVCKVSIHIKIKSKDGFVPQYAIKISNSAGEMVVENLIKEKSDINFFDLLFKSPGVYDLEREIAWDGKDKDEKVLPDGEYSSVLWVKDASSNVTEDPLIHFIVDTKAPEATINPEYDYFSPNGDGNQDTLIINFTAAVESKWEGVIKDSAGTAIKTSSWTDAAPDQVVWDGMLPDGTLAPDGTYVYTLTGSDKAGNTGSTTLDRIVLDTRETPLLLTLSSPFFSPNEDGNQDDVTIYPAFEERDGLLSWQVSVADMDSNVKRTFSSEGSAIQEEILFDGKDESGNYLAEGEYQVILEATYNQGNNPLTTTPLTVDLLPPQYSINPENSYFSPNSDGYGDILAIAVESDEEISWTGDILDADGNKIRDVSVDVPSQEISWDGKDNDGNVQSEGIYTLSLHITDRAGNWAMFSGGQIVIDLTPPESYIALSADLFSPNGDGQKDTVAIEINTNEPVTGNCVVKDADGNEIQYVSVFQDMTLAEWDGKDETGTVVPDGAYTIEGVLYDLAGNNVTTEAHNVSTDTRSSKITVTVPKGFSPNGDTISDVLVMEVTVELLEGIVGWNLFIEKTPGVPVKTYTGEGEIPATFEWDGIDDTNQVQEGTYTAKMRVAYQKGDVSEGVSNRFKLDISPPEITLDVKKGTEEAEDPLAEEYFITMDVRDESEISEWELDIVNNQGDIIRSYGGEGDPSEDIAWNASGSNEKPVPPEDQYTIVVKVTDVEGNNSIHKKQLPLDLLIARIGSKYYLIVPNIIFGKYQYKLDSAGREMYQRNLKSLKKAAEIYKKFPQYKVGLEGHALNIYLHKGEKAIEKEEKVLVPLTKNRATTVQNALVKEGIEKDRIELKWFGGKNPIVSVEDRKIYWKNRRVEFLLIKPETEEPVAEEEVPGEEE